MSLEALKILSKELSKEGQKELKAYLSNEIKDTDIEPINEDQYWINIYTNKLRHKFKPPKISKSRS